MVCFVHQKTIAELLMKMALKMRKNILLMPIDCDDKDFNQIEDNLFLSNKELAHNNHSLTKIGITLVIAVYPKELIGLSLQMIPKDCRFHNIDVKDSKYEDLISRFDDCYHMITEELTQNDGKVLVYCGAGYSRSVTIVSAFLMRKYRISANEAVERIRRLRDKIHPNSGFLAQLDLYEEMGFEWNPRHLDYRLFAVFSLRNQIWTEKYWQKTSSGQMIRHFCEPMQTYFTKLSISDKPSEMSSISYLCLKCEHYLFEELNVLSFPTIDGQFDETVDQSVCKNVFTEPLRWMTPLICNEVKAKLLCPNCGTLLGKYKWKSFKDDCPLHNQLKDSRIFKINKSYVKCIQM